MKEDGWGGAEVEGQRADEEELDRANPNEEDIG